MAYTMQMNDETYFLQQHANVGMLPPNDRITLCRSLVAEMTTLHFARQISCCHGGE